MNTFQRYCCKKIIFIFLLLSCSGHLFAQSRATWIWYPGDYEIWLANRVQNRRTDRGSFLPVFWKMDSHYVLVEFHKAISLTEPETIHVAAEGQYNVKIDGKALFGFPSMVQLPAGHHTLSLKVYNQAGVPAVYVQGPTVVSDSSWLVTFEDKEWIDASGKVSDKSGTTYCQAGFWNFNSPSALPSAFRLPTIARTAKKVTATSRGMLLDFGKETFGFIKLWGIRGNGNIHIYYGESKNEALSTDSCETLDQLTIQQTQKTDSVAGLTKAFRYVNIQCDGTASLDSASMLYQYSPVQERGGFRCSDTLVNRIWDVAAYTLHLNTREFFIDGIKRDRWIWSGDACQSYLMNYYLFFDSPTVRRTTFALRGKDPVTSHINTIMDYSFYWFMGIHDYYQYTGDQTLITALYPRMKSLMDFCLSRRDSLGFMEGKTGDWVFIDWAKGLSKNGALSFEQILFCRSLETMADCARLMKDTKGATAYQKLASSLRKKIFATFWNPGKQAFIHSNIKNREGEQVFKYSNMFALFFNYLNPQQRKGVIRNVLLNDQVPQITTPYMRFYESAALCDAGKQAYVLTQMKDYWGGMLARGATSFWEQYDPGETGAAEYAMYGRPFGKSLCHAWGASPVYLLGKYYLGVQPVSPGYETYRVEPSLGGLKWMEGTVPTPHGAIKVREPGCYGSRASLRRNAARARSWKQAGVSMN